MNCFRVAKTSDTTDFDIDNISRLQVDGAFGVVYGMKTFIQANRIFYFFTQKGVKIDVIFIERLLDHQKLEPIP